MPDVEVTIPDDLYSQLQRIADEDFVNEQDAVEQLISQGLDAYRVTESTEPAGTNLSEEFAEDMWDTAEDPAARDDAGGRGEDEYTF